MAAKQEKCAIVICLDVGPSMNQSPPNHVSFLETACSTISTLLQRKVFAESKDEVALILFGCEETANHLAEEGYHNIKEVRPIAPADFDLIQYVDKDIQPSSVSGDFVDVLVVAVDLLHNATEGKKFTSTRILLFSDLGAEFSDDRVDSVIEGLKKMKTDVNLIGPSLDEDDDMNGDENRPSTSGGGDNHRKEKTPQQRAGAAMMRHLLNQVDGDSYTFSEVIPMLCFFEKRSVKPTPWKCTLEIGENLQIACCGYLKLQEGKLKKAWGSTYMKGKGREYKPQRVTSHHLNNDEETEIEKDDIVEGYRYGTDLIPMSKEDKQNMAYKSPGKCLQTLGFTKEENVKRHMRVGNSVYCFISEPGDPHADVAFSAIVNALYETKSVIIVRRCYSARSMPRIGFLVPQIKASYECLYYTELPYAEDIKQYTFSSLTTNKKLQPTDEQLEAMDNLITSMDLMEGQDDDGEKVELFKPKLIFNPYMQRIFQCLQHRALHPDDPLPDLSPVIAQTLQQNQAMEAKCTPHLENIKQLFKLQKQAIDQTKTTGSSLWKDNDVSNDDGQASTKNEQPMDFSMASIAKGATTEIGTVDPIKDFRTILAQNRGQHFDRVFDEMKNCIIQLLKQSFGNQVHDKVLECVKVLRYECSKANRADIFNTFLQELKVTLPVMFKKDFWQDIQKAGVSLIAMSECNSSNVTKEDALKFLQEQKEERDTQPVEEDEDDLLDMM